MKECPYCGSINLDESLACHSCNAPNSGNQVFRLPDDKPYADYEGDVLRSIKRDGVPWIKVAGVEETYSILDRERSIKFNDAYGRCVGRVDFLAGGDRYLRAIRMFGNYTYGFDCQHDVRWFFIRFNHKMADEIVFAMSKLRVDLGLDVPR